MITAEMAKREIAMGLSAICAWCEHFHDAKLRGEMISCGKRDCGGPSKNRAFPQYKGPISGKLASICFICGEEADAGIGIGGGVIGVCNRKGPGGETHLEKFKGMITEPGKRLVVNEVVVPVVGGDV